MALSKWIPISEAVDQFIDYRLNGANDGGVFLAYDYAHRRIIQALAECSLPATPANEAAYCFEFISERERKQFPLEPDGTISGLFWQLFREAREDSKPLIVEQTDYATLVDNTSFRRTGLKDGGVATGKAGLVLVERAKLGLPRRRGEKGASYGEEDSPIVELAIEALRHGKTMAEVKAIYAPAMPGLAELPSKKARLASRIKDRLSSK